MTRPEGSLRHVKIIIHPQRLAMAINSFDLRCWTFWIVLNLSTALVVVTCDKLIMGTAWQQFFCTAFFHMQALLSKYQIVAIFHCPTEIDRNYTYPMQSASLANDKN